MKWCQVVISRIWKNCIQVFMKMLHVLYYYVINYVKDETCNIPVLCYFYIQDTFVHFLWQNTGCLHIHRMHSLTEKKHLTNYVTKYVFSLAIAMLGNLFTEPLTTQIYSMQVSSDPFHHHVDPWKYLATSNVTTE